MAEWPVASVAKTTDIVDEDAWEAAGHDPRIYAFLLRQRGELQPLQAPFKNPTLQPPVYPLSAAALA